MLKNVRVFNFRRRRVPTKLTNDEISRSTVYCRYVHVMRSCCVTASKTSGLAGQTDGPIMIRVWLAIVENCT